MEDDAAGHRYGNFPNYYAFNPPKNRLDVLRRSGILDYILSNLTDGNTSRSAIGDGSAEMIPAAVDGGGHRKKPRLNEDSVGNLPKVSGNGYHHNTQTVNYCDLGCNEGDLTMAMAAFLSQGTSAEGKDAATHESCTRDLKKRVKFLGLDIDSKLIERATSKYCNSTSGESKKLLASTENIDATFKTADLCSESKHNDAVMVFLDPASKTASSKEQGLGRDTTATQQIFDLTTIFSTTMWIHVHGGDEVLKSFLERACGWTKTFILIEPQPSGCYRKANVRLRKMGLPELKDVTSTRLKLRPAIEEEIEKIVVGAGFQRVQMKSFADAQNSDDDEANKSERTDWNRALHLYRRKK
jgi:hypothetical protein